MESCRNLKKYVIEMWTLSRNEVFVHRTVFCGFRWVPGGYGWFLVVLVGSLWFWVVLGGSSRVGVIIGGTRWFWNDYGLLWRFFMVLGGSR